MAVPGLCLEFTGRIFYFGVGVDEICDGDESFVDVHTTLQNVSPVFATFLELEANDECSEVGFIGERNPVLNEFKHLVSFVKG